METKLPIIWHLNLNLSRIKIKVLGDLNQKSFVGGGDVYKEFKLFLIKVLLCYQGQKNQ